MYLKTCFTACLFPLVVARMELKPAQELPDQAPTPVMDPNSYSSFSEQPWCSEGWHLYLQTNSCFRKPQLYHTLKHTAAQEFCRKEGGSLATVTVPELQHILRTHNMQAISSGNSTSVWWMGYMLVPTDNGGVEGDAGASGNLDTSPSPPTATTTPPSFSGSGGMAAANHTTVRWQVTTEQQTGPEPLVENSANIPTTVPQDLQGQPVVCVQLKLVHVDGFLKKWGWNLAQCDETVPFVCKKAASKSCHDRKGHIIPEGQTFTPPGHDGCTQCTCRYGQPDFCSIAGCAAPNCLRYEPDPDRCCQFTCLDIDTDLMPDNDTPEPLMSENMRWVLTMITSFLLLGMMLFMVYRMRQKRIAYLRYRVQQLRDGQEGDFEPGSGPPPVPALDDIDGAIFREPPPPYSFFKDTNRVEMPPPYNVQQNAMQRIGRHEVNHNRDSRGSDQPDDVRLLPGSEPTTPSDISTISTLASPPPYNRCQSTASTPLTPPESTPMLGVMGNAHSPARTSARISASPAASPITIRNTTV